MYDGFATVFSGGGEVISGDLTLIFALGGGRCLVGGGMLAFTPYE